MVSTEPAGVIRLARPEIGDEEVAAAAAVLRSGQLVQGPEVAAFEDVLSARLGAAPVVAVSNGTAALHLALLALGVGRGDRVAVPTFSFPATANAVELVGATPLFIDIEALTFGMDPERLAEALGREPRVKAIMPVHAFGGMAQMAPIAAIAAQHGIPVIEDAACALGCVLEGVSAGCWGPLGCFSFHPRKAITTGEGGAIVARTPQLRQSLRALRNHGLDPDSPTPDFVRPGFNYRLSEMQAAVGRVQLGRLDALVRTRRELAARYDALLEPLPVVVPRALSPEAHVYQSYVVLLPADVAPRRGAIIASLRSAGVETTIGTYHMPLLTWFRTTYGYEPGGYPVGEALAARALALPMHARLDGADLEAVVAALGSLL
jgi:dTDP-4-amino-4,6-dideoxygalactose transaminase